MATTIGFRAPQPDWFSLSLSLFNHAGGRIAVSPPRIYKRCGFRRRADLRTFRASKVEEESSLKRHRRAGRTKDWPPEKASPAADLKVGLEMCSKRGDAMAAISLFDSALREGVKLNQYHYSILLYLCGSAAVGVVHPGKSGNSNHGTGAGDFAHLDEETRNYTLARGFEIYEQMCREEVPPSEAALTSVARMAMAMSNGDMAFEIVKKISDLGLPLRLRSYGPALFAFCNSGDIEKAFEVEKHMAAAGVHPEEPELQALLKISISARKADKVYYTLNKLRIRVGQVSAATAELIESWFKSATASRVGKRKWDAKAMRAAAENGGGGWHGQGWLGRGRWTIKRVHVDENGVCGGCGEKLVTVDLDPVETENFARSVAAIAGKRERNSSFQRFQRWVDYHGPFEAVIDAANIGLYSQRGFSLSKVNRVANAVRQKLPSKKRPLVVVHNRRISGPALNNPRTVDLIEKLKQADAIYATPTGSNDDWYWLYAAIKCKGLIVTNDEMRDHTFQLLGNDFFPKWKERHQVHFAFQNGNPEILMPPSCSTVVQESERGHWHVPIADEQIQRTWLCITRNGNDGSHLGRT